MKTLAWLAIGSGVIFGALTFAVPSILRWQANHSLEQFDAVRFVPELVEAQMVDLRVGLRITQVISGLSIVAGYLIFHRKRAGLVMWASVCVLSLAFCVVDFGIRGVVAATAIRAMLWIIVLIASWSTFRKPEHASWWS
jgi:hypothetical protein